ncbi:MAG: hypothetical protein RLO81_14670 [Fulvivirga sp.]|uniref:SDH family Clp fold serine proteinase n=1 Tax=Fulvivirga sp. TaxID=1931237 RepID=UPI0032EBC1BD
MSKNERIGIIKEIQNNRESCLISYVTTTRAGGEVQMAMDSIRHIFQHIQDFKKEEKFNIDLFLYSNGGDGTVPWRLVTLIREYSKRFSVLIPFRAFSAATLTALGADEIIMHPMGMLGPTDPTVSNDFNPENPTTKQKLGISVEDVTAYINLIKEDAGITHEDELVQAFTKLTDKVHPLALGNVKRSLSQSRMMARKLLALHMDKAKEQHQIDEIIDNLTSKLFFHGHPINRTEADKEVGIRTVKKANEEIEGLIWNLYLEYEKEMKLNDPFNPVFEFIQLSPNLTVGTPVTTPKQTSKLVYIESENATNVNILEYEIMGVKNNNGVINTQMSTLFQGWKTE